MARREKAEQRFDTELADLPPDLRWRQWMNRVEAVIFAAPEPVSRDVLCRVIGQSASLDLLIDDIREELRGKPFELASVAGGFQYRTRAVFADAIGVAFGAPRGADLTPGEAMVLVAIAYQQPVTRGEVAQILGRDVSRDVIAGLRRHGLITAGPRSPTPGGPYTYVTTKQFLAHFSLGSLAELPEMEALEHAGLIGDTEASRMPLTQNEGD